MAIPFALVSQVIGLGSASGTRAGLSLLAVAVAAHTGTVVLPPELTWMTQPGALAGFAVVLAFEMFTQQDEDMRALLGVVQYGISGASGALVVLAILDVPTENVPQWAQCALGTLLAAGSLALRRRLQRELEELSSNPQRALGWLGRVELVVTLVLCLSSLLIAPLALVLVLLAAGGGLFVAWVAHKLEARLRRPCPACHTSIRQEASRCPRCRAEVPVERRLDLLLTGKAEAALRHAVTSVVTVAEQPSRKTG